MTRDQIMKSWERKLALIEQYSEPTPVLDKGFVRLVDVMGDDEAIVQAARVSYDLGRSTHEWTHDPGSKKDLECSVCGVLFDKVDDLRHCPEGDRRLIRYLSRNRHTSPLEMCEIKLHVKLPIFVARQWIRHRTGSFNEMSLRYSEAKDEFFLLEPHQWRTQDTNNKQGSSGCLDETFGRALTATAEATQSALMRNYENMRRMDVTRELARIDLPVSVYTEWYWKTDLHNLLHFLALRMDPHAQEEVRAYALILARIVEQWVPFAWEAFKDYRFQAVTFSRQEHALLQAIASGEVPSGWHLDKEHRVATFTAYGIETVRERSAFMQALGLTLDVK